MQLGILDWILEQKRDISGKTVETLIKSIVPSIVPILASWFWSLNQLCKSLTLGRAQWNFLYCLCNSWVNLNLFQSQKLI